VPALPQNKSKHKFRNHVFEVYFLYVLRNYHLGSYIIWHRGYTSSTEDVVAFMALLNLVCSLHRLVKTLPTRMIAYKYIDVMTS
jgi:hypothetical protein